MKTLKMKSIIVGVLVCVTVISCTDLETEIYSDLTPETEYTTTDTQLAAILTAYEPLILEILMVPGTYVLAEYLRVIGSLKSFKHRQPIQSRPLMNYGHLGLSISIWQWICLGMFPWLPPLRQQKQALQEHQNKRFLIIL